LCPIPLEDTALLRIRLMFLVLLGWALIGPGCAYKVGGGLTAGVLDEMGGAGRTDGVETMGDRVLERALLVELGHQLGSGLRNGATEVSDAQQKELEDLIDGIITVAAKRAGKGLRNEVSPELRGAIQNGIVDALADGLRGELGDSMEETVDRVVHQAIVSLRLGMAEEQTRYAMADLLRESVYYAMREGQGVTPSVAETIEFTLTQNMLQPLEESVGGITDRVAWQVEEQARRTENLMMAIIGVLLVATLFVSLAYVFRGLRLQRIEEQHKQAEGALGGLDLALEGLDAETRAQIEKKIEDHQNVRRRVSEAMANTPLPAERRSDDYMR
jgi:hypothetical protein